MNFESREMFSSSNSSNPFPQLPPYFHLSSPSFPGQDGPDIFLHHHPDLLVSDLLSANYPVAETISGMAVSSKATTTNQETSGLNEHHCTPQNLLPRKKPGKKDRHSKIFTARGPRDRRVRLSIDIAHKFFHLQDMLGFDKASKTLEWLLTKSKVAIKELMQSLNSTFECEVVSGTNEAADNGGQFGIVSKRKHFMSLCKEKKMKQTDKDAFYILARESRAKARARARERTREKMCTRRLNDSKEVPSDSSPILNQSAPLNPIESSERMMGNSTVRKKKLKPSSIFNDQQNLAKDASSVNIPQNWDIEGNITRSSFCAMTNMNLFPEFQICSKLSEVCNNQSQC